MLEISETRKRFVVEEGKMKCNLARRTSGKRCGSTLMIDRSITCSAGHKFTLDELVAGSLRNNQWMDNNPWEFDMLLQLAEWHHPERLGFFYTNIYRDFKM